MDCMYNESAGLVVCLFLSNRLTNHGTRQYNTSKSKSTPVFSKFQIAGRFQRFRLERTGVMFSQISCFSAFLYFISPPLFTVDLKLSPFCILIALHKESKTDKNLYCFPLFRVQISDEFLKKRAFSCINSTQICHSSF